MEDLMKEPIYARIFNYDKNLLPNTYLKNLEEGVHEIETAIQKSGYSIGYPGWNLLYYTAICSLRKDRFNNILETGTNLGCSTIILAQALKDSQLDGCVYTVELDNQNYNAAVENIEKAKVKDFIKIFNEDSLKCLSNLNFKDNLITYAFLDGCHDQENVFKEFKLIYPYLDHKSCVAFDNTYLISEDKDNRRVNGALQLIQKNFGGNLVNFENVSWYTPGLAIWQKDPFHDDWAL
jgi:predicted O-methyltransferase YrrM